MENESPQKTAQKLGLKFVQDISTNLLHIAKEDGLLARCNSRFNVEPHPGDSDYLGCVRCIAYINKLAK